MSCTRTAHRRLKPCVQGQAGPVSPTYSPRETDGAQSGLAGTRFGVVAGRSRVSMTVQRENAFRSVPFGVHTNRTRGERMTAHDYFVRGQHVDDGRWGHTVYDVYEFKTSRKVSAVGMSHEEAVVLCERLNRLPAAERAL